MEKGEVMTTVMRHEPSTDKPGFAARLLVPGFWGTLSIVAMWLATLGMNIRFCRDEGRPNHDRLSGTSATCRIPAAGL